VGARSLAAAAEFAAAHGVAAAFGSYAEMLAAPGVDVVYIGTITPLHKEHALLAIAAGKAVLCEKPLAASAADAAANQGC
jgi:predicted dehydrogenase